MEAADAELAVDSLGEQRRSHPVPRFMLQRTAAALVTLLVISMLIFVGTEVLPGDVANAILGRNATPAALATLRNSLHLNQPTPERYLRWLFGVLHGNLGISAAAQSPIWPLIRGPLVNSAILAGVAVLLLVPLSLALGVFAATRAGAARDHAISVSSLMMTSVPEFVTGTLLVLVFSVTLHLLPGISFVAPGSSPLSTPTILILPVVTLLGATFGATIRMVRAGMVDVLRSEYVDMARLNGFPERTVITRYAMRNALAPAIQVFALNIQWLVGGIVVTEYVFNYPGIGQGLVRAVSARDIPLVQSVALLIAAVYLALNIFADLLVVMLNPKLRTA